MAADESIDWEFGNAPKQSITELLHNPRGPTLELPEVTLELPALSLTPAPPVLVPEPVDINHFESYLRRYAPLYEAYQAQKTTVVACPQPLDTVPSHYFESDFSFADNHDFSSLLSDGPLSDNPELPKIRKHLASHKTTLEHHLKRVLDEQSPALTAALQNIHQLREAIRYTATAIRETRENAEKLLPTVISPIEDTKRLSQAQTNLYQLKSALKSMQLITSTPSDVAVLLDAGEYAAAIDAVHSAREELSHPHLARITALASVRAKLAQSVESIDTALRGQFRNALMEANEALLKEVVGMVSRLGRLDTLHRFFMREIKDRLAESLSDAANVSQGVKVVSASVESAVMLVGIIHDDETEDGRKVRLHHLQEAYADFEELLVGFADRMLGSFAVGERGGFIVITSVEELTAETCFDEFKAALRFGEEIRNLDDLTTETERMFGIEKRGGSLRAKISERQISFVGAFHKAHAEALGQAVRSDKWQEVRVPDGASRLLAAVIDVPTTNKTDGESNGNAQKNGPKASAMDTEVVPGAFMIGSSSYKTVACAVRYVRSMCAYILLAEKSPALASEIARRGADYCRNFNSLVGKAVLGAAALQWAGLRSITARHLSLASRTIAMAASLAEQANRPLKEALSGPQAGIILPILQRSEKDLRDHHGQLLAKILAIMMDRLEVHETVLKSWPWDKYQEMQRFDIPSNYIVTLAKEATVLHRILWSVLPKTEVFDIFQRVCAAYGTHLTEAYSALDGGKRWIRMRVAKDVACLHERLLALDVFKANPDAFKPLSKLYTRFSKEFHETESKNPGGRSFIRQKQEQQPKSVVPDYTDSKSSNGSAPKAQKETRNGRKKGNSIENDDKNPPVQVVHPASDQGNENATLGQTNSGTDQAKQTRNESKAIAEAGGSRGEALLLSSDTMSNSEIRSDIKPNFKPDALLAQPENASDDQHAVRNQENGHVEQFVQKGSDDQLTASPTMNGGEPNVDDLLNQEFAPIGRVTRSKGTHEGSTPSAAEGDLLHLGDED